MNAYELMYTEIKKKNEDAARARGKATATSSKSDLENLGTAFLNTPTHEVKNYVFSAKDTTGNGEPVAVTKFPVVRYRKSIQTLAQNLGLDRHDAEKAATIPLSKEHASSMLEVSMCIMQDYMKARRKLSFPITEPDEARMEVYMVDAPERVSNGSRFKKEDDGMVSVTKKHRRLKVKNQVPAWIKEQREREK